MNNIDILNRELKTLKSLLVDVRRIEEKLSKNSAKTAKKSLTNDGTILS